MWKRYEQSNCCLIWDIFRWIYLEWLKRTMKSFREEKRSPSRHFNPDTCSLWNTIPVQCSVSPGTFWSHPVGVLWCHSRRDIEWKTQSVSDLCCISQTLHIDLSNDFRQFPFCRWSQISCTSTFVGSRNNEYFRIPGTARGCVHALN
jgi:hypothetical protein